VQGLDGRAANPRAGSHQADAQGQLVTGDGKLVLGENGPILLPPFEKMEIGDDGTITLQATGQAPNALAEVGRLKLVNPADGELEKGEDGLMRLRSGAPMLPADPTVRVAKGFLESSNVNVVEEFTQIISLARQFEMQMKMMRTVEDNSSAATRLLQQS
jgi:flagellar basal-body rod protein FlgF